MNKINDPTALEEAVSALREELLKDLVESVSLDHSFNETTYDHTEILWLIVYNF